MDINRYARSLLLLGGFSMVLVGGLSALVYQSTGSVQITPVVNVACALLILILAGVALLPRFGVISALASLVVLVALSAVLESTPLGATIGNWRLLQTNKYVLYALALASVLAAAVVLVRGSLRSRRWLALDVVALAGVCLGLLAWVSSYALARALPGVLQFSGQVFGQELVAAVLVVYPVLVIASLGVAAMVATMPRLRMMSGGS